MYEGSVPPPLIDVGGIRRPRIPANKVPARISKKFPAVNPKNVKPLHFQLFLAVPQSLPGDFEASPAWHRSRTSAKDKFIALLPALGLLLGLVFAIRHDG